MSEKSASPRRVTLFLIQTFFVILGCSAVWWGINEFPTFRQQSSIEHTANRILAGDSFKAPMLSRFSPIIDSIEQAAYCRPVALQSAAIVKLRIVETAFAEKDRASIDENMKSLRDFVRSSLYCKPADPFLWLVLWWIESTQNRSKSDGLEYLRMSYLLGPNEGWIAQKRNRLTFSASEKLPADLVEKGVREFVGLVDMGFYEQAAEIFFGPARREQQQLLARLQDINEHNRRAFAGLLFAKGYDGVIPGVERPVFRFSR